MTVTVVKKDQE